MTASMPSRKMRTLSRRRRATATTTMTSDDVHAMATRWRAEIREIFIERKPDYSLEDAARLLDLSRTELLARLSEVGGTFDGERLPWASVGRVAFRRWPALVLYIAISPDVDRVLPHLIHLEYPDGRLPASIRLALHDLAAADVCRPGGRPAR